MKFIVYHLFKDIMSKSTPSDNKTGTDIGIVLGLVIVGIITILVIIVTGKYITIILNITSLLINSTGLSHHHVKDKTKQEK